MTLIWAYGQTGVDFYKEGELKYHGGNRGILRKLGECETYKIMMKLT